MSGWKWVPVEPTPEMKIAGVNAGWLCTDKYRAMLDAAPPPAADAVSAEVAQVALRVLYSKGISITRPAAVSLDEAMRAAIDAALAARGQ